MSVPQFQNQFDFDLVCHDDGLLYLRFEPDGSTHKISENGIIVMDCRYDCSGLSYQGSGTAVADERYQCADWRYATRGIFTIGSRIKAAREKKKLTQEELAALLDMSTTHISVIERGVKPPKLETFIRIANVLGVSSDYLLMDIIDNPADVVSGELSELRSKLSQKETETALAIIRVLSEEE